MTTDTSGEEVPVTEREHAPRVDGGPRYFGWVCDCGKRSSKHWSSQFEAAYAALVHARNPDGPS